MEISAQNVASLLTLMGSRLITIRVLIDERLVKKCLQKKQKVLNKIIVKAAH